MRAVAMKFNRCEEPPTEEQSALYERELGLRFPPDLKAHYHVGLNEFWSQLKPDE
jgi:hypothetical protein